MSGKITNAVTGDNMSGVDLWYISGINTSILITGRGPFLVKQLITGLGLYQIPIAHLHGGAGTTTTRMREGG